MTTRRTANLFLITLILGLSFKTEKVAVVTSPLRKTPSVPVGHSLAVALPLNHGSVAIPTTFARPLGHSAREGRSRMDEGELDLSRGTSLKGRCALCPLLCPSLSNTVANRRRARERGIARIHAAIQHDSKPSHTITERRAATVNRRVVGSSPT